MVLTAVGVLPSSLLSYHHILLKYCTSFWGLNTTTKIQLFCQQHHEISAYHNKPNCCCITRTVCLLSPETPLLLPHLLVPSVLHNSISAVQRLTYICLHRSETHEQLRKRFDQQPQKGCQILVCFLSSLSFTKDLKIVKCSQKPIRIYDIHTFLTEKITWAIFHNAYLTGNTRRNQEEASDFWNARDCGNSTPTLQFNFLPDSVQRALLCMNLELILLRKDFSVEHN